MKVIIYTLMSYPLMIMSQSNDGFVVLTKKEENQRSVSVEKSERKVRNQFSPQSLKLRIKAKNEDTK